MAGELLDFCIAKWRADGALRARDAYKWLYQATLGVGHALHEGDPRAELEAEWEGLGAPREGEPDMVQLEPQGRLVRLNLRPYKASGGDIEELYEMFMQSVRLHRADLRLFLETWRLLGARLREYEPIAKIEFEDWRSVDKLAIRKGYPILHDSEEYCRQRAPAYRVIVAELYRPL